MKENKNVKSAGLLYLIGNLFNKGIAFLTVPIFTRILSTYDYGFVTTYNSWVSILNMIVGCALTMGIRAAFIDYEDKVESVVSSVITFTIITGGITSLIAALICSILGVNNTLLLIVLLCFLQGTFWAIIDDYTQYLMMKYRYKSRTLLMILPNLLSSIASILVILCIINNDLYLGRIIPTALVYIVIGLFVCKISYKKVNKNEFLVYVKYSLKISLPLVLHGIALNVLSQSDRTMITWLADASQTGIYSLIYNFSMIATVLTTSLDGIWIPFFISSLKDRNIATINEKAKWYVSLMTFSMVGLILVGPEIVKLLASKPYWEGINIIPPIVLANYLIFAYTLYVNIEHYYKNTKIITVFTLIAAIVNFGLNYLLIPKYGYVAAAYTTLVSYLIVFVLHAINAKRLEKNVLPVKLFFVPFLEIVITVVLFYCFVGSCYIRWGLAVIYTAVFMLLYRKELKLVIGKNRR